MAGDHDATEIGDTNTSSNPPPRISVPHNVFINLSSEFKKELAQILDGGDDDDLHKILNFFDSILYESCKKACSLNQFFPVRICGDQWLRSEIMFKIDQAESLDVLAGDIPLGRSTCGQALNYSSSESREFRMTRDMNITTRSNILPRQASLKKLLTSVAKISPVKSLGMPWRILTNIAGRVHRPLGFDAIEDGDKTCTLPEGSMTDLQVCKADVKLPVVPLPELWSRHQEKISKGEEADVWRVIISQGVFAMKKFKNEELLRAEADIVEVLSHPHIVHTFGSTGIDQLSLLMECMEDDLSGWITYKPRFQPLDSLDVLLQVAQAMEYLHGERVVHGDLKSQNILISEFDISRDAGQFMVVKVADFGRSQKANSTRFSCKPGTTKWSSPEVLKCIKSRDYYLEDPFKADVYSFGLIVYEVLTGLVIFDKAQTVEKMKEHIMANNFSQYFTSFDDEKKNYPEFFISFMKRCWAFTPTESPSFHEIIEKIKEARSSLITRSSKTHGRNGRFTRMKKFMKKVTNCRGMATKVSRIFRGHHARQPISSLVASRILEDKTEINEKNKEVKKGLMITKSQETPVYCNLGKENPNLGPMIECSKSTLRILASMNSIKKALKAKTEVKKLGNKGGEVLHEMFEPKNTAKQVPPPPTQPISSSGPPIESRAQEDKGTKRRIEDDACKDDSEEVIKSNKKSKSELVTR